VSGWIGVNYIERPQRLISNSHYLEVVASSEIELLKEMPEGEIQHHHVFFLFARMAWLKSTRPFICATPTIW